MQHSGAATLQFENCHCGYSDWYLKHWRTYAKWINHTYTYTGRRCKRTILRQNIGMKFVLHWILNESNLCTRRLTCNCFLKRILHSVSDLHFVNHSRGSFTWKDCGIRFKVTVDSQLKPGYRCFLSFEGVQIVHVTTVRLCSRSRCGFLVQLSLNSIVKSIIRVLLWLPFLWKICLAQSASWTLQANTGRCIRTQSYQTESCIT